MSLGVARAPGPRLAVPVLPEASDEGSQVREMSERDLGGGVRCSKQYVWMVPGGWAWESIAGLS